MPWQDESALHFTVSDTGVGMDEAFMKKLFTPFERAESAWAQKIEGTGLGMSIARQLTEMMHGTIHVDSAPGVGTTIQVQLPLLPVKPESSRQMLSYMGQCVLLWDRTGLCVQTEDFLAAQGLFCRADADLGTLLTAAGGMEAQNNLWGLITDGSASDPALEAALDNVKASLGSDFPVLLLTQEEDNKACPGADGVVHWPLFRNDTLRFLSSLSRLREPVSRMAGAEASREDFSHKKLLLVEDNELNQEIAQEFLSEAGVSCDTAARSRHDRDMLIRELFHALVPLGDRGLYIRSVVCGKLNRWLAGLLREEAPELLEGLPREDEALMKLAEDAGLFHDVGLLLYPRNYITPIRLYLQSEEELRQLHAVYGRDLLLRHDSARRCAWAALGHHSADGYPAEYRREEDPTPVLTDMTALADFLSLSACGFLPDLAPNPTVEERLSQLRENPEGRFHPALARLVCAHGKELPGLFREINRELYTALWQRFRREP